jgi:cytoskeletal protein RodZ
LAKNEDGELEYILGNRQLISVFLIVVILLGVFFSMGYIVGRNSAMAPADTARDTKSTVAHWPPATDSAAKTADTPSPEPPIPAPAPSIAKPELAAKAAPAPSTATATNPVPAAPPPPAKQEKPRAFTSPQTASVTSEPASGDYWQVVATARPDAEIITEALTKKGFHAVMAPAPKEGTFRVLVGPLHDAAAQAQTRTSLEEAGFKNPIRRKY